MKRILLVVLVLAPLVGFGQAVDGRGTYDNSHEQKISTTMTEWKYCTIGYKTQMESGLDPAKKGYEINETITYTYSKTSKPIYVKFVEMVETETKTVKAVIVVVNNTAYSNDSYYCIPNITFMNDYDVGEAYEKQNAGMVASRLRLLLLAYTSYLEYVR